MEKAILSLVLLALGAAFLLTAYRGFVIVPQSEKYVVERLGKFLKVLGPGLHFIVPWIDNIRAQVSILEHPLTDLKQDAITRDNVIIQCVLAVFYRVTEPEKTVYRIDNVDRAVSTMLSGIVRSEIGKIDLDQVQSNRDQLNEAVKAQLGSATLDWGIVITRAEVLDVNLDQGTREAMMQQIAAERQRRAAVTRAEGERRAIELQADGELYSAERLAEARRLTADADAYATEQVSAAISQHGTAALEFEIRKRQVEAMAQIGSGEGSRTVFLPADIAEAFGDAAKLFARR